jgi:hypothetical protein
MMRRWRDGSRPAEPPVAAITSYAGAVTCLRALGFSAVDCTRICRRKAEHAHMRHGSGTAELVVFERETP